MSLLSRGTEVSAYIKMRRHRMLGCFQNHQEVKEQQGSSEYLLFSGNDENLIKNGAILLEERIALFEGRTNPIRFFSVDDLNLMKVSNKPINMDYYCKSHAGVWDGKSVLVKIFPDLKGGSLPCREIAVATQMGTHRNVHRLLGCCLDTDHPVLVYDQPEHGTLHDRILDYDDNEPLQWKERVRIGWETAHAVAYLHTGFRRPIIHRDLKPGNVLVDQDGGARLSDFGLSISIPEGKTHVADLDNRVVGTNGYLAPDYAMTGKMAASTDVYAFGVLLLELLTGKPAAYHLGPDNGWFRLVEWVRDCSTDNCLGDIVDPTMAADEPESVEHLQRHLKALVELSLRCTSVDEENRPTMVDVATKLKNIIMS